MEQAERETLRRRNDTLRTKVDAMLARLERQTTDLDAARRELATSTSTAWSADRLARVTVDAAGITVDVHIAPEAFRIGKPEQLGTAVTEATKEAARLARLSTAAALAPIIGAADDLPDLPDAVPGARSLRGLSEAVTAPDTTAGGGGPTEHTNSEPDDDGYHCSFLQDVR